jgi:hypothetical protein
MCMCGVVSSLFPFHAKFTCYVLLLIFFCKFLFLLRLHTCVNVNLQSTFDRELAQKVLLINNFERQASIYEVCNCMHECQCC